VAERTVSVRRLGETRTETAALDAVVAQLAAEAAAPDSR
jgi:threonyl-tRNA synthetase